MRTTKRILSILLLTLFSSTAFSQTEDKCNVFKESLEYEFGIIERLYKDCMEKPCYGDSTYYDAWYKGIIAEKNDEVEEAIENYLKAINFTRFELSTYEVKLSLGRIELIKRNLENGKKLLSEFIVEANTDINDEESMWGLTEEGIKELNDKIAFANRLLQEN